MKFYLTCFLFVFCLSGFAQNQQVYKSKNLPRPDTTWVFMPKTFEKSQSLPVIFLLHGYSGNYKQWNGIMDAQKYADEYNMVIVCPDGMFSSWYLNSPVKPDWQYENFFFDELFPDIKKQYNFDEKKVFITGLSMGGHGALHLFIKRPDLFTAAGSTSGGVKLAESLGKFGLPDLLGNPPAEDQLWKTFSVLHNIEKLKGSTKPIYFDCGASDFFYVGNNELKQKCDDLKLNATYLSQPGAHNGQYWKKSIKQQFEFFKNLK